MPPWADECASQLKLEEALGGGGTAVMATATLQAWLLPPPVPVKVIVYEVWVVEPVVFTVPTVVAEGGWVLLVKLIVGGVPEDGLTEAVKVTAELKPFCAVVFKLTLPDCPTTISGIGLGLQNRLKSTTFKVAVSLWPLKLAVIVTVAGVTPVAVLLPGPTPFIVATPVLLET